MHDAVAHRDQPQSVQRLPGCGQLLERRLQGRRVVDDRSVADPFDDSVGDHCSRVRLDDSVFQ